MPTFFGPRPCPPPVTASHHAVTHLCGKAVLRLLTSPRDISVPERRQTYSSAGGPKATRVHAYPQATRLLSLPPQRPPPVRDVFRAAGRAGSGPGSPSPSAAPQKFVEGAARRLAEVEAAGAVQAFLRAAGRKTAGQDVVLVAVAAGEVEREARPRSADATGEAVHRPSIRRPRGRIQSGTGPGCAPAGASAR